MNEVPDYTSPCNRVCTLGPATEICMGCFRTLDEISGWVGFTNAERRAIRAALPQRETEMKARRSGG